MPPLRAVEVPGDPEDPQPHRALATTGRQHARSLTAAATRFDLSNKADRQAIPRNPAKWQDDAWAYFDLVNGVKFGGRFMGNALSRIRLYPGIRLQPDEAPISLRDLFERQQQTILDNVGKPEAEQDEVPFPALTIRMVEDAEQALDAIANRRTGQAGLMSAFGTALMVSGDSWLIGTEERDPGGEPTGEEEWIVASDQNLRRVGDRTTVKLAPGAKAEEIPEDATLIRVWRPHPAWPAVPDSNLRAVLDTCDDILALARTFRSTYKSRNHAGILLLPSELDFTAVPPGANEGPEPQDGLTPFERAVLRSFMSPVETDGSAAAAMPHIFRGPAAALEQVRWIDLGRRITADDLQRAKDLITALAQGLDMPAEVLLGIAGVNHWGAWQIEDSTYKTSVEPTAALPAWAITTAYLRPYLRTGAQWASDAAKALIPRVEVGLNASALVARPNRAQDAKDAHKALVLSHAALRRELGFSDNDAPSDDEYLERYTLERGIGGQDITRELLRQMLGAPLRDVVVEAQAPPPGKEAPLDDTPAPEDQPTPPTPPDDGQAAALVVLAAAARNTVGARLAAIDQRLRDRLQVAASAAVDEAVRVAGNRLRSSARNGGPLAARASSLVQSRNQPALKAHEVGAALHAAGVLTPEDEDAALGGAFTALEQRWDEWVSQAQDDTEAVLRSAATTEDDEALDNAMQEYRQGTEQDRRAGWGVLLPGLTVLARHRIRGLEEEDEPGEHDATLSVPTGPVREALARAGGSVEPTRPPASVAGRLQPGAAGGVATGPQVLDTLPRLGLVTVAWEWNVGAPSRPFPPHQRLSGQRFQAWNDPVLAYSGWPGFGHSFPGDHRGCQCSADPVIVPVTDASLVL